MNDKHYAIATVLDPRFMIRFIKNPETVKKWILEDMKKGEECTKKKSSNKSTTKTDSSLSEEIHADIWECFDEIAYKPQADSDSSLLIVNQKV